MGHGAAELLGLVLFNLSKRLVLLETYALFLLLLVELLVVFLYGEELRLDLYHLLLVQF